MIGARFRHPVTASLLAAAIGIAALLPPAHIHLAGHDDHDHAAAVEHAHWGGHYASRATFADDDGRVIFVDHPAVASSVDTTIARPAIALTAFLDISAPPVFTTADRPTSGNSPRDGPARVLSSLRAPPVVR